MKTNKEHCVEYLNHTISQGKLLELVTCRQDLAGCFANIIDDLLREQCGGKPGELFTCEGCHRITVRRKKTSNPKKFCDAEKCRKIKALGRAQKPVTFDSVPNKPQPRHADQGYYGGFHT